VPDAENARDLLSVREVISAAELVSFGDFENSEDSVNVADPENLRVVCSGRRKHGHPPGGYVGWSSKIDHGQQVLVAVGVGAAMQYLASTIFNMTKIIVTSCRKPLGSEAGASEPLCSAQEFVARATHPKSFLQN
jgi:hypothetical protein